MTIDELIEAIEALDVQGRAVEQIYAAILNGRSKDQFHRSLTSDESKFWDILVQDMKDDPLPEGSHYAIPSED